MVEQLLTRNVGWQKVGSELIGERRAAVSAARTVSVLASLGASSSTCPPSAVMRDAPQYLTHDPRATALRRLDSVVSTAESLSGSSLRSDRSVLASRFAGCFYFCNLHSEFRSRASNLFLLTPLPRLVSAEWRPRPSCHGRPDQIRLTNRSTLSPARATGDGSLVSFRDHDSKNLGHLEIQSVLLRVFGITGPS